MKRLIIYLVVLIAAVWLGLKIAEDPGYALFAYQRWTVEMPLWLATLGIIFLMLLVYGVIALVVGTTSIVKRVGHWQSKRKVRHAHRMTSRGLLELAEGKWGSAEKCLRRAADESSAPLINYLAAARAAQEQGAYERRDDYLRMAHECTPGAEIAVGLTQAQLQLSHQQLEHSLATLRHLQNIVPHHAFVLKLLKNLYVELNDWESIIELLPELRKRKVVNAEELFELDKRANLALLNQAIKSNDYVVIDNIWQNIPRQLRQEKNLAIPYIKALQDHGRGEAAENLLRDLLKHNWDSELVALYGDIHGKDSAKQLATAEAWLRNHGNSPAILLTLGQLCIRNQLWGKGKQYLESSLDLEPDAKAFAALGKLYEHLGENDNALKHYRDGLVTVTG